VSGRQRRARKGPPPPAIQQFISNGGRLCLLRVTVMLAIASLSLYCVGVSPGVNVARHAARSWLLPTSYTPLGPHSRVKRSTPHASAHSSLTQSFLHAMGWLETSRSWHGTLSQLAIIHNRNNALSPSNLTDPPRPP
jgi:hypothetical protein